MARKNRRQKGFTFVELLVVVSVLALLASVIFMGHIYSTYQKARDSKRKQDLNKLARTFEDYYNDNQRYPPGNTPADGKLKNGSWGSAFGNYLPQVPADPLSPSRDYYYQVEDPLGSFFVLYAKLENSSDPDIIRVGCQDGCGPIGQSGQRNFNYIVTSGDVIIANGIPNGEDPGAMPGIPTATPSAPTATPTPTPGGPTPTPNCPPGTPAGLCCGDTQCCQSSQGKYCGLQQCPGNNNKCVFVIDQYQYLCSYDPVMCP